MVVLLAPQKSWLGANASFCSGLLKNLLPHSWLPPVWKSPGSSLEAACLLVEERGWVCSLSSACVKVLELKFLGTIQGMEIYWGLDLIHRCSQGPRIKLDNGDWIQLAQGFGRNASVYAPAGASCWFCAYCRETPSLVLVNMHLNVRPPSKWLGSVLCTVQVGPGTSSAQTSPLWVPSCSQSLALWGRAQTLLGYWLPQGTG